MKSNGKESGPAGARIQRALSEWHRAEKAVARAAKGASALMRSSGVVLFSA
jgi:hypothetical protein